MSCAFDDVFDDCEYNEIVEGKNVCSKGHKCCPPRCPDYKPMFGEEAPRTYGRAVKKKEVSRVVEFKEKELGKREMRAKVIAADVAVGKKFKTTQLHFEFEPIGLDWENQHEWYMLSDDRESAYGVLTERLVTLKLITSIQVTEAEDLETLAGVITDAVKDKEIYWKEEPTPKKQSNVWLPQSVKEVE